MKKQLLKSIKQFGKMRYLVMIVGLLTVLSVLTGCAKQSKAERILMVNDKLYYCSDETGPMGDADCVAGKIASTVEAGTVPKENGQSNFGCVGNPYTYDFDDAANIQVLMEDEEYHFFYTQKEAENECE